MRQIVRNVREQRTRRRDPLDDGERLVHGEVCRVRTVAKRVHDEDLDALEQRPGVVGDRAAVGQVREAAKPVPQHQALPVPQRHRYDEVTAEAELSYELEQVDLRNASSFRGARREDVGERAADLPCREGIRKARDRAALERVVAPHLVEPHHVIGVAVGVEQRVHARDTELEGLRSQVGRGVHEHVEAGKLHVDRRTPPAVPRIARRADGAAAADHRHAMRGAGAEERDARRGRHGWMMRGCSSLICTYRRRSS
jgi:hypothetical protein